MEPSEGMWSRVQSYFEAFGAGGNMAGWLTCEPGKVAEILNIEILEGL
jgi:hypothetical protein